MDKVDKTGTIKAKRYSLVPIYFDESVSIPDSSVTERDVLSCVSNEELGKSLPDQASTEMSKAAEVTSTGKNHNMLILLKISKYLYTFWIQKSAMGGVLKPFHW